MGARPIAVMDPLRFGPLDDARSRWIAAGVVSGISGYGNSVGVPTVGGEIVFDECYAEQPSRQCPVPRCPARRIASCSAGRRGRATSPCCSARARAATASAACQRAGLGRLRRRRRCRGGQAAQRAGRRPLRGEAPDRGLPRAPRRSAWWSASRTSGGAGLTCATSETASRGGVGMDVDVRAVHPREPGMEPFEVMTSESQERMLAIVTPENLDRVLATCAALGGRAAVVGPRHRHRAAAHPRRLGRAGPGRRAGRQPARRRPELRPARRPGRRTLDELAADDPGAAARAQRTAARTCSPCSSIRPGCTASTTISCS